MQSGDSQNLCYMTPQVAMLVLAPRLRDEQFNVGRLNLHKDLILRVDAQPAVDLKGRDTSSISYHTRPSGRGAFTYIVGSPHKVHQGSVRGFQLQER